MAALGIDLAAITQAGLEKYLIDPQALVPCNSTSFTGLNDDGERAKILTYLMSLR